MDRTHIQTEVMRRLKNLEGQTFQQVRGKTFTYTLQGETVVLSTTNRMIPPSQIHKALLRMPVLNVTTLQDLQAPSYLYALLMDKRIKDGLY